MAQKYQISIPNVCQNWQKQQKNINKTKISKKTVSVAIQSYKV